MTHRIWNGIYQSFSDVESKQYAFDTDTWTQSQVNDLKDILNGETAGQYKYLLKPLFDINSLFESDIKIIDFGGGLGITYLRELVQSDLNKLKSYIVIERPEICKIGRELLCNYTKLSFHDKLIQEKVDIIFCGSSFHYIEDWMGAILDFTKLSPKAILFSDIPAGDNLEFITAQSYYNNRIPVRFFNLQTFSDYMNSLGYRLSYKKDMENKYNSHLHSFDAEYRVDCFKELLFIKNLSH